MASDLITQIEKLTGMSGEDKERLIDYVKKGSRGMDTFAKAIENAAGASGTLSERINVLKEGIVESLDLTEQQAESFGGAATTLAAYALQTSEAVMSVGNLNKEAARLIKRQRESAEAFNRTTGFAGQFNTMIMDSVFANRDLGLSAEENAAIFANLTSTFTDFTINGVSPTERGLVEAAQVLQAVGIDAATSAKSFQILRKGFGQTDEEIVRTTLGLENFAEELGVTSEEIFATFNEQMPTLAMFGSEAERVFRQAAAAAKSTGIEFEKQMGIFNLTDTFEQSAGAVGQLNALLGGPFLNAVELTMAETPVERMQMLSQAFSDAGISVEDLSRRQIQAFVAATPGIESATDLVKLQKGGFDDLLEATDAVAKSRGDLADEAATRRPIEENMEIAMEVMKGVDGIAQKLDVINTRGFTPLIQNAEALRDTIESVVGPTVSAVAGEIERISQEVGLTTANLNNARQSAINLRNQDLAEVSEGSGGDKTVRIQLMLDGYVLKEEVLRGI